MFVLFADWDIFYEGGKGWLVASSLMLAGSFAFLISKLVMVRPLPLRRGGLRGKNRRAACCSPLFTVLDLVLRYSGSLVALLLESGRVQGGVLKQRVERTVSHVKGLLVRAAEPAGLDESEVLALCAFFSFGGAGLGYFWGLQADTVLWVLPGAAIGAIIPTERLRSIANERAIEMMRELPAVIDLAALSMTAGLDFSNALRRVTEGQEGVVAEEISQVLLSMDLGITRSASLRALEERVPVQDVRDLVRAVIMAEKKGASLSVTLQQQAVSSRLRRSIRGEEAAARASVMLLIPLMLLTGCILIILVGPLVSSGIRL